MDNFAKPEVVFNSDVPLSLDDDRPEKDMEGKCLETIGREARKVEDEDQKLRWRDGIKNDTERTTTTTQE